MPDPVATDARQTPPPFQVCSECRSPLRAWYYALNERPICGKCRPKYAALVARSEGSLAFWRVTFQGALVAAAGALVIGAMSATWQPLRFFLWAPIGYLIGRRIMAVVQKYSARRYQYLAVGLTYLSFLVGIATPIVRQQMADRARDAEFRAKPQGTSDEVALMGDLMPHPDSAAVADSAGGGAATAASGAKKSGGSDEGGRHLPSVGGIVMFLLLPLFSILTNGLQLAVVNMFSLGAAFYFAWRQTDGQGWDIALSGPYKLGEGPIARG